MPTVREIMDPDLPTVLPSDTVEHVVHVLRDHDVPGVAVVNEGGRCIWVVTQADLVIADEEGRDLHLPHMISLFGGVVFLEPLQHLEDRLRKVFANTVSDMMTADVQTIAPTATVHEAARLISRSGHNRLPVTEDGRLVGVVTRVDALAALTREG